MREDGYYWIVYSGEPDVARWENGRWWMPGDDSATEDEQVIVVSERLQPPCADGTTFAT